MLLRSLVILDECHGAKGKSPMAELLRLLKLAGIARCFLQVILVLLSRGKNLLRAVFVGEGGMCSTQRRRTCCSFSLFLQSRYRRSWSDSRLCRCFSRPNIVKVYAIRKSIKHIQAANVRKKSPLEERPRILGLTASFLSGSLKRSLAEKKKPFASFCKASGLEHGCWNDLG